MQSPIAPPYALAVKLRRTNKLASRQIHEEATLNNIIYPPRANKEDPEPKGSTTKTEETTVSLDNLF